MSEHIVKQHPVIEELFSLNAAVIGKDAGAYKNHVYRVFNYCLFLDDSGNEAKYAIAAFFHDIGIWTNNTFDYLAPSIMLAKNYLRQTLQEEWTDEISRMIDNHHKISFYSGDEHTVEIFRIADWTDVSMGWIHFEIPGDFIQQASKQFPYRGFHFLLIRLFFRNLLQHPFRPLPMFRK